MIKSNVLLELKERGFIKDCTNLDGLDNLLVNQKITLYCGFDLTADCLHVGSLMPIMAMRIFKKYGHNIIALLGDGTTKIGDPSGKDKERPKIDSLIIEKNKIGIKKCLVNFLGDDISYIGNDEWLSKINYIDFLNEIARHFTVSQMLRLDSVKLRLEREQSISLTEFNYSVLQAYDFCKLNKEHNCILQLGGSDQWGNIVSGVDLTRRKNNAEVFGLTFPLLTTSSGKKMGKSESGAIWIHKDNLSSFDYFQYFRNTEDGDVIKFLKLFTDLTVEEINEKYFNLKGNKINEAKEILAFEATKICHNEENANNAIKSAKDIFQNNKISDNLDCIDINSEESNIIDTIQKCDSRKSRSDIKKLIKSGAVKINGEKVLDINFTINSLEKKQISIGKQIYLIKIIKKT